MRTIFGKLNLPNPRLYTCSCQPQATKSVTPLAHRLPERTTPELKYLQSKWASLVSYGLTVGPDPYFYGIPMLWDQMPEPSPPLTVGIDGGYIHARDGDNR